MSIQDTNDKIISLFESKIPFSVIRIGNMEGYFIDCYHEKDPPLDEFYYWLTLTSGVYPHNEQYLKGIWLSENLKAIDNADVLGFVDVSGEVEKNTYFRNLHCNDKYSVYGVRNIEILDPGILLDESLITNPWTKQLKGKRVLVVSSHINSIKHQITKLREIWGDKLDDIAGFELVDVIRSPFHPQMDDRQYPNCYSWDQTLHYMNNLVDSYDYDVLLVGAAAYSPALANHAKEQGKIGITICGAIQLYFGILGSRWFQDYYSKWRSLFNDSWIYPLKEDLPKNIEVFNRFEGAYW